MLSAARGDFTSNDDTLATVLDMGCHGSYMEWLVVERSGDAGDHGLSNKLAQKADATTAGMADVKSQIHFRETAESRSWNAQYARLAEIECDQAHECIPPDGVQFATRWQRRLEK
jgi:hypothetical protein